MIFVSPTINHLNLSILCEHNVHCLRVSRVQTRETCQTARQKRVTHKTQLLASGSIDFRLSHRFTVANPSYTRETILLRPRFLEKPRHRRLSDIFQSSTWQNYPIYTRLVASWKRVEDRAIRSRERGPVPRHKMLEKLVKSRVAAKERERTWTKISRPKVERRNIRHTSGRTRLNEREFSPSTGFLYFSASFCAWTLTRASGNLRKWAAIQN